MNRRSTSPIWFECKYCLNEQREHQLYSQGARARVEVFRCVECGTQVELPYETTDSIRGANEKA